MTHVVILGAGPAGLGAAYQLAKRGNARVTVLEQQSSVGGNAGSFLLDGIHCDYGSHRLHPAGDPGILRDLHGLLNGDLLLRPRHGRILLQGRWIHFPLKPIDLLLRLRPRFSFGLARDIGMKILPKRDVADETFATVLERGLGKTICANFYFPYARKLWALGPEELSATQARKRVSASSFGKLARRLASAVPGLRNGKTGYFYYPRKGFGEISERLFGAAKDAGAEFRLGAKVAAVASSDGRVRAVRYEQEGREREIPADHVWSTLPINLLVRLVRPEAPGDILNAASGLTFRGMILIYLVLEQDRFTEFDAHYFPEESIPISRLSEPKNYSETAEPRGRTVLCAELPCGADSPEWELTDDELGRMVCDCLARAGLPAVAPLRKVVTRRLKQAYPIYRRGYETRFALMDRWLDKIEGLLTFGRQGLFVHDNTHHALYMARAAAECVGADGSFDRQRWHAHREVFETHVVED